MVNSNNLNWISGKGIVKQSGNMIIGTNCDFKMEIDIGDKFILINPNELTKYFHSTSTNPKLNANFNCTVTEILSNNILLINNECDSLNSFNNKGDYIISKSLYQFNAENEINSNNIYSQSLIDVRTLENINFDSRNKIFNKENKLFYHEGFILNENSNVIFKTNVERM